MKNGVTSYSFSSYLDSGRMTLKDVIVRASAMGFDGVEIANITGEHDYPGDVLRKCAENEGIEICAYSISSDFAKNIQKELVHLKEEIDYAHQLGAGLLRTDIYHADVKNPYNEDVIEAIRCAADYAFSKGIKLATENHGGFFRTAHRLEELFCKVNHPNFGLLCDFANFADAGEEPDKATALLYSYVCHVHMKDCHLLDGARLYPGEGWYMTRNGDYLRCSIVGQGNLPLYQCLKLLYCGGFDGYLIQEFEGIEDCLYAVQKGLDYTRRLLAHIPNGMWQAGI